MKARRLSVTYYALYSTGDLIEDIKAELGIGTLKDVLVPATYNYVKFKTGLVADVMQLLNGRLSKRSYSDSQVAKASQQSPDMQFVRTVHEYWQHIIDGATATDVEDVLIGPMIVTSGVSENVYLTIIRGTRFAVAVRRVLISLLHDLDFGFGLFELLDKLLHSYRADPIGPVIFRNPQDVQLQLKDEEVLYHIATKLAEYIDPTGLNLSGYQCVAASLVVQDEELRVVEAIEHRSAQVYAWNRVRELAAAGIPWDVAGRSAVLAVLVAFMRKDGYFRDRAPTS
jgi:hypothetical protein